MVNKLKVKLDKGEVTLGGWVTIGHPEVAEVLANLGFDWIIHDMEHSPLTVDIVQTLLQATGGTDPTNIVRVPWNDPVTIKRVLDIGAEGIMVPWVNTREEALQAVRSTRYPPDGIRGVGPRRVALYGLDGEYMSKKAKEIFVIVQIETKKAVDNIEQILSVDGVDCVFIGPADLSTSLGHPMQFGHPVVQKAIDRVLKSAKSKGVATGTYPMDIADMKRAVKKGFNFVTVAADLDFMMYGVARYLEAVGRKPRIYGSA